MSRFRGEDDHEELDLRIRRGGLSRPQPLYRNPAGPIRRASTLPVRFADERIVESDVPYPATEYQREYLGRDDYPRSRSRTEPRTYDSPSDEGRPQARQRDSFVDDRDSEVVVVRERPRSRQRYQRRSHSRSPSPPPPVIINNRFGRERLDSPHSSLDLDYERELSRRTLRNLGVRRERESEWGPDRGIYEDEREWEKDAYSFTLSRHTKSLLSRESTLGSISDASDDNESQPAIVNSDGRSQQPIQAGKILRVISSKYTGDGTIGGIQSAELTIIDESIADSREGPQPAFRWIQFEDPTMNLDKFETGCRTIVGLTESQTTGINRIFSLIRRKADKPIQVPGGGKVRFMVPGILQEMLPKEPGAASEKPKTIRWMCLPYFCLQNYSGNFAGLHAASHPVRTLMQARFSLSKKERDLEQAVCHLLGTPRGHCFHIAQVWCLVIDEALFITCSATPISTLAGKHMSTSDISLPTGQQSHRRRPTHLLVSSGQLLWSFPLDECQSWFKFMSHFWEYWPRRLEFSLGGKPVMANMWQKVIDRASKSLTRLDVDTRPAPIEHPRGILLFSNIAETGAEGIVDTAVTSQGDTEAAQPPESSEANKGSSEKKQGPLPTDQSMKSSSLHPDAAKPSKVAFNLPKKDSGGSNFHVFTWLNETPTKSWQTTEPIDKPSVDPEKSKWTQNLSFSFDEASMNLDLEEIDLFLQCNIGFQERLAYEECQECSRDDVYKTMHKELEAITSGELDDSRLRGGYENKVELLNKSEMLFQFFLPTDFEGPTVKKFWGALSQILLSMSAPLSARRSSRRTDLDNSSLRRWLGYATPIPRLFQGFLSTANSSERSSMDIPEEFPKAWLHLLMAFVFCSTEKLSGLFEEQIVTCNQLMDEGMRKVVLNFEQKSLLEYAVFRPGEMASLVNFVVLGDITPQGLDTSNTYFDYLSSLESAIQASPLDRGHQYKITSFKQEISAIVETLQQQQRILEMTRAGNGGLMLSSDIFRSSPFERRNYHLPEATYPDAYGTRSRSRARSHAASYVGRSQISPRAPGTTISQLDATDPTGIQGLLIQDSQALIDRKIREFEEMNIRSTELEAWNIQKIDYNKDRQEAAIYAFTIVTIVFLPISAVAGIMGMNVNDIRNMELNQWVFWVVSLPLAVIIIVLCLIWAGELENVWNGFRNLWRKKPLHSGARDPVPLVSREDQPITTNRYRVEYDNEDDRFLRPANTYRPLYGRSRRTVTYAD